MNNTSKIVEDTIKQICKEIFSLEHSTLLKLIQNYKESDITQTLLYSNAFEASIQESEAFDQCEEIKVDFLSEYSNIHIGEFSGAPIIAKYNTQEMVSILNPDLIEPSFIEFDHISLQFDSREQELVCGNTSYKSNFPDNEYGDSQEWQIAA